MPKPSPVEWDVIALLQEECQGYNFGHKEALQDEDDTKI